MTSWDLLHAQRLMGRRTKTLLPTTDRLLRPKVIKPEVVQQELTQQKERQKYYYDKHATPLTKLNVGDHVTMQIDGKWRPATVTSVYKRAPCSYFITTPEGQTYRSDIIYPCTDYPHHYIFTKREM